MPRRLLTTRLSQQDAHSLPELKAIKFVSDTLNKSTMKALLKKWCMAFAALSAATAIWLPTVHLFFKQPTAEFHSDSGIPPKARALAARHLQLWTDPKLKETELERMRSSNAEWDFMGRTFLVWSLAEMSVRDPSLRTNCLATMDTIISETIRLERERGFRFFLMPYAKAAYVEQPARSLFLDSEIALMLALRRVVEEKPDYRPLLQERIAAMLERMQRSPALVAESYPNECWLFDHAVALAAIRIGDWLDGTDHGAFLREWLRRAQQVLVHPESGLLVSSFTTKGRHLDGPEGSSIWMAAHCLRLVDEDFARDQFQRARRELARGLGGFAWSREWPVSWHGPLDVDSGMVIPVLDISAGGSGMAFIGASSFGDMDYLSKLHTALNFAAFPSRREQRLKYCASNQVGDAALLYASVLGPIWEKVKQPKP
jgi:hypothetical protein